MPTSTLRGEGGAGAAFAPPPLQITYHTDPLCAWSWAFEPQWRRLRLALGPRLQWRCRMGGLIPDWSQFGDPINDIARPAQMGPHWFHVQGISGQPLAEQIWYSDPPASSYPACLAVKAAERQGPLHGERLLRRLREAVMLEGRNIARRAVLLEVAGDLADAHPQEQPPFDTARFAADLDDEATADALRADLQEVKLREIGRFPTLVVRHESGQAVLLTGWRPYAALVDVLARLAPCVPLEPISPDPLAVVQRWGRATAREVAEALDTETAQVQPLLDGLAAAGALERQGLLFAAPRR